MLQPGLSAELLPPAEQRDLLQHHPDAQTAAQLIHGACSCDLVRFRHPVTTEDEAHLRERYRKLGLPRAQIIQALDNHRRALEGRQRPEGHWPGAVASFVVEHARNAGPTLYFLHFSHDGRLAVPAPAEVTTVSPASVRQAPVSWLPEERLVMVVRPR